MFIAALFTIAGAWKQLKCPSTDDWTKRMWFIHAREYASPVKKNEAMPCAETWLDLELVILSEVR